MRVFISHSARTPTLVVRQILANLGAEVSDAFASPAEEWGATLLDALSRSDAVVALVDKAPPNVFYELGLATAMEKPVLVLQAPETALPPFLGQVPRMTSDLNDSKALRFTLEQFLKQIGRPGKSLSNPKLPSSVAPSSTQLQKLAEEFAKVRGSGVLRELEKDLGNFLKAANVRVVERGPAEVKGADLAVWSDGLSSTLGNPILVELKAGRIELMNFRVTYSNLAYAVQETGTPAGLLLYLARSGRRFEKPNTWVPNVFFCDLEDFATRVVNVGFDRTLLDLRNEQVHGVGR